MKENKDIKKTFGFGAKAPRYFGIAAIGVFLITIGVLVWGFYWKGSDTEFRIKSFPASLSKDVVAVVNNYQRSETEEGSLKYEINADKATLFSDGHHEFDNVFLKVFNNDNAGTDEIKALRGVYVPAEEKNFTIYLAGQVAVLTRDELNVKTDQVTYTSHDQRIVSEEKVEFSRFDLSGNSVGAVVNVQAKTIELKENVLIEAANTKEFVLRAGNAIYDQLAERISMAGIVNAVVRSGKADTASVSEINSDSATILLHRQPDGSVSYSKIELNNNVAIDNTSDKGVKTLIRTGSGSYQKDGEKFDLVNSLSITTEESDRPVNIKAGRGSYEQTAGRINIYENAVIDQAENSVRGDHIYAELSANKKLRNSQVNGNAQLINSSPDRTTEINGDKLSADFDDNANALKAVVNGSSRISMTPQNAADYSKVTMSAERSIQAFFKGRGAMDKIISDGRTSVKMLAPDDKRFVARTITADKIDTSFDQAGKFLTSAEANGNAVIEIDASKADADGYSSKITAPRFECRFYEAGNDPQICNGGQKTRTVRTPVRPAEQRAGQQLDADRLVAYFDRNTRNIERLEASGNASFKEKDRRATADDLTYSESDKIVRLRGKPSVSDSNANAKAGEIDWDTSRNSSVLRNNVTTSYFGKAVRSATPFGDVSKPIYISSNSAEFDHQRENAVFIGNARGWQEKNYLRGDRLDLFIKEGRLTAEGNVQSLLYNVKRNVGGRPVSQPVQATAAKLAYDRDRRLLRYENAVKIRQGTDEISGRSADIYFNEQNEVYKSDIKGNVVVTQPGRKAVAENVIYDTAVGQIQLSGDPVRVEDAATGISEGAKFVVNLNENRVESGGGERQNNSGRTRSVYKVRNN